ncbi:MAG TPA: transposase [Hanamia sp.]|nr:transposase [Hanamia sp.]
MEYTFAEYADMYMTFGLCEGNSRLTEAEYRRRFPNRRHPCRMTFVRLDQRLRVTGSFVPQHHNAGRPRNRRTVYVEEEILRAVEENPQISTREIAHNLNVPSNKTVHQVLQENLLRPFRFTKVQPLYAGDNINRTAFCNTILQHVQNENFLRRILWSDECTFTRDGVFNSHNSHYWAMENPKLKYEIGHQRKFSVNVWMGIINHNVIGPIFIQNRLNAAGYLEILHEVLDNLPLARRQNMLFMNDGAPAHNAGNVRQWITDNFGNNWIGRNGPIPWPARSPDLNPMDFFVWGYLKEIVYATPPQTEQELRDRIDAAAQLITAEKLDRVHNSIPARLQLCLNTDGYQFEQLN